MKSETPPGVFDHPAELERLYAAPVDEEPDSLFPLAWYEFFLQEIKRLDIGVLTYRDVFEGSDAWDHSDGFGGEFKRWHAAHRNDARPWLLIQHDVDDLPFFTQRMVAMEHRYGVRSNIFMFRERYDRETDAIGEYPVDHGFFQQAEQQGFVIGYHQNAFALSGFDLARAEDRFRSDVAFLRDRYQTIDCMVPHGGPGREICGRMLHNIDVPVPSEFRGNLRWVYNRHGVSFTRRWSDGGIRRSKDLQRLQAADLVGNFLHQLEPGTRNFCLVHPQRWGFQVDATANPLLAEQGWYREVCERFWVMNERDEKTCLFPLGWYEAFLEEIGRLGIRTLTYRDLFAQCDDRDYRSNYPAEWAAWQEAHGDNESIYLLIQHDVDSRPGWTQRMVGLEREHSIRSSIFMFNEIWQTGQGFVREYAVDHDFFQQAEQDGFVIGYHQNAFQLAGFDLPAAEERFRQDVMALRQHYTIEFMVPHGGRGAEVDGVMRYNHDVPVPAEFTDTLRWVYNKHQLRFNDRWSDGGLRGSTDPERLAQADLLRWLQGLQPGTRNYCLVHPQYWGTRLDPDMNPVLAEQDWFQDVCGRYGA